MIATKSHKETVLLGERIGKSLKPNDIVALSGELGAGKTTLIQGIAKGLGVQNWVTSPTFTIVNEFKGKLNLYHMDLYRINNIEEAEDIAIEEYFTKGGVTVIEWAEKIRSMLPDGVIGIKINVVSENERSFNIEGLEIGDAR
ncbi:MAG: tRNA (adenosine(37)-N6)-threonylcarbamoyltransferase complex ATPase subunit type 1 TsaE [bacterium]